MSGVAPTQPRCGYDLRGAIDTWRDACPLRGTCTECGLSIYWAEVLVPDKFEPPWCVEFVDPLRRFGWAWVQTVARSGRPFRFWSTLKMSMFARPVRLMAYVVMLVVPILLAGVTVQTVVAIRVRILVEQGMQSQQGQLLGYVNSLRMSLKNENLSAEIRLDLQRRLAQAVQWANAFSTWTVNHSYAAAVAEAVLFPLGSSSWGTMTSYGMAQGYVAPRDLHATLLDPALGGSPWRTTGAITLVGFAVGMWIAIIMPFAFVLLPISRRRAKVRWGHLARVASYGMVVPSVIATTSLMFVAIGYVFDGLRPALHLAAHVLGSYGVVILTIGWWIAAIRCYLHIPHGWAVAPIFALLVFVILFFIGFLIGVAVQ